MFKDGKAPPLSKRAKENVKLECNRKNAVQTDLKTINAEPNDWRGMCVML